MTSSRDDETLRRYREANAALGEQPSASARAAILAAAARQVQARPQSADALRPAPRRRWPLAAAATVLLSTLAVMLATRTEQEMPTFTPPADRAAEAETSIAPAQRPQLEAPSPTVPEARTPAAPPIVTPKQAVPAEEAAKGSASTPSAPSREPPARAADAARSADPQADAPSEQKVTSALGKQSGEKVDNAAQPFERSEQQRAADEPAPRAKEEAARESASGARQAFPGAPSDQLGSAAGAAQPPASAPAPASSAVTAPVSPSAAGDAAPSTASRDTASKAAKPDAQFNERARRDAGSLSTQTPTAQTPQVQSAPAPGALRQQPVSRDFERSVDAWLEYIARLRRDGRHDEGDAELKRFRERFPAAAVPPAALPPPGTR